MINKINEKTENEKLYFSYLWFDEFLSEVEKNGYNYEYLKISSTSMASFRHHLAERIGCDEKSIRQWRKGVSPSPYYKKKLYELFSEREKFISVDPIIDSPQKIKTDNEVQSVSETEKNIELGYMIEESRIKTIQWVLVDLALMFFLICVDLFCVFWGKSYGIFFIYNIIFGVYIFVSFLVLKFFWNYFCAIRKKAELN